MSGIALLLALTLLTAGCAASKAFRQGDVATRAGDLDQAVAFYRAAVQAAPERANYKIALQRAMLAASRVHLERARDFEKNDQLEASRGEYKLASEYDPQNGYAATMIASLDQRIRDRIEAARPRPMEQLRSAARAASAPPLLNPASREPIVIRANNTRVGDILNTIGSASGINITYHSSADSFLARATTMSMDGLTIEQALNAVLQMNQLSYKVVNERSILVFQDSIANHNLFDDQVVQTFYVANADVTELTQLLSAVVRFTGIAIQPIISASAKANTITVRATTSVLQIIDKIIQQNDKPRAEVIFDVEILEVDRNRVKQYGLNLTDYALGGIFSPEVSPGATTTTTGTTTGTTPATSTTTGRSTAPTAVTAPPPFNLNTISQGFSTTDFYLAVPAAFVVFLESDTHTKLVAKPQVRGADGTKITVALGTQVPIVSTSYTPIATGGAGVNPLNSFSLKDVGINLEITPRVTTEGDITVDLMVESSTQGPDKNVAGTNYPTFGSRKVTTKLRLRDGESNLLAGLLREDEASGIKGAPGAIHVPFLKQLFSSNDRALQQTDLVMLLTPHIIRTSEITASDLQPVYIGSQQNLGVGGPPPLIAPAPEPTPPVAAPPPPGPTVTQPNTIPPGVTVAPPPGSSPVPGTVVVPPAAPPGANAAPVPTFPAPTAPAASAPAAPPFVEPPAPAATAFTGPGAAEPATPSIGLAQVIITPSGTVFRVGGGPYLVPISVVNASRLSTITLTLTFDPALLRARSVQEGSFMRLGGASATFTNQVSGGRVDITINRAVDATGASGTGLLGATLFDAIAPGTATLTVSGAATGPGGTAMGLQFRAVTVTVQR